MGDGEINPDWRELVANARMLLHGYITEDPNGLRSKKFIDPKTDPVTEDHCREALAIILSTGKPPKDICDLLAGLFAPDGWDNAAYRKIIFKHRSRGRVRDHLRDSAIALKVAEKLRENECSAETAIADVAEEIGMTSENVEKIWKRYKPYRDAGVI